MKNHMNFKTISESLFKNISNNTDLLNKSILAFNLLKRNECAGNDFLGWFKLPNEIDSLLLNDIQDEANRMMSKIDYLVVVGIGGSYLGAKAIISALKPSFGSSEKEILFAGNSLSEDYHSELLSFLEDKEFGVCVISKSGTTTEPAIAFRLLKKLLESKYSNEEVASRIVAITDSSKGALKELADKEGIKTYTIPDNVGGRYSVLTPVGLFPIAAAGFNIKDFVEGARDMSKRLSDSNEENMAIRYAACRKYLYDAGKKIEILASFNPRLHFVSEWWKQLFGESDGKDGKGIFPASVDYTTDLHSLGQYIQDGERIMFETFISVESNDSRLEIPLDSENLDNLNYLSGKNMGFVNEMAEKGTMKAHEDGGVPLLNISIPSICEKSLGELMYFFELSCALSGLLNSVNPFNQPGVEEYKKNMFSLLGKK